jgi:hypothetical protein
MIAAVLNEVLRVMNNKANESHESARTEASAAVHQEALPINF